MSESYGQMVSYPNAIKWVEEHAPDGPEKGCVLARMRYQCDMAVPVKPRFSKGKYGKKYDDWVCGNCGQWGMTVTYNYCPNCGFRIGWDEPRCLMR